MNGEKTAGRVQLGDQGVERTELGDERGLFLDEAKLQIEPLILDIIDLLIETLLPSIEKAAGLQQRIGQILEAECYALGIVSK